MTGRLDAVDLKSDLLLIGLISGPKPPEKLYDTLNELDFEPFVFEWYNDVDEMGEDVGMFILMEFITASDKKLKLTDTGRNMATILKQQLDSKQTSVLENRDIPLDSATNNANENNSR